MEDIKNGLKEALENCKTMKKRGFRFIARSESGELRAFIQKPIREFNFWWVKGELPCPINSSMFDKVEWSDEQPMSITSEILKLEKTLKGMEE